MAPDIALDYRAMDKARKGVLETNMGKTYECIVFNV